MAAEWSSSCVTKQKLMLQQLAGSADRLWQLCVILLGMSSAKLNTGTLVSVIVRLLFVTLIEEKGGNSFNEGNVKGKSEKIQYEREEEDKER